MFLNAYNKLPVVVTGHTGFKGSWLCEWLSNLGAEIHGYGLTPQPHETLFDLLGLEQRIHSDTRGDVRDLNAMKKVLVDAQPSVVFHLAAQPLVRRSFDIPVDTFEINMMGTVNLLEAVRVVNKPCVVVVVTTDKCYENREWLHSYREEDPVGGYDPYSASKACVELVVNSYRKSFFNSSNLVRLASARAGNVIGGGDWAIDRIVPDIFRAIRTGQPVPVRNKTSTRPWQHVLEPLSGYLWLGACLHKGFSPHPNNLTQLCSAFNFGPPLSSNRSVLDVVKGFLERSGGEWVDQSLPNAPHEASRLNLSVDKAYHLLEWMPNWLFSETIEKTATWYQSCNSAGKAREITKTQIRDYELQAIEKKYSWANLT
jgi:CDP-glucose 4,6-dehydratase